MGRDNYSECGKCGALVGNYARHVDWHESLERLMPDLRAVQERVSQERAVREKGMFSR
ncbi:hypothetical protein [Streptomyces sp. NPDC008139]|uniref:hypothetical protein n=1 Tax=Streptomyces sp. NPDC008139 TaxID=3364814 RepID=UPI0036DFDDBA